MSRPPWMHVQVLVSLIDLHSSLKNRMLHWTSQESQSWLPWFLPSSGVFFSFNSLPEFIIYLTLFWSHLLCTFGSSSPSYCYSLPLECSFPSFTSLWDADSGLEVYQTPLSVSFLRFWLHHCCYSVHVMLNPGWKFNNLIMTTLCCLLFAVNIVTMLTSQILLTSAMCHTWSFTLVHQSYPFSSS